MFSCVFSYAYRSLSTYLFCTYYNDECVNSVIGASISHFQLLANDSLLIICFFKFYTVYLRLKIFVSFVENNSNILECLLIYKSIVDTVERTKKVFDILYVVALAVGTPNLIVTTYMGLSKLKSQSEIGNGNFIEDNIARSLYCIQDFGLLFGPAMSAGLLTSGVNKLKVILQDRLLQERDQPHVSTISVFCSYVEARALTLNVLRLARLDWSLPVLLLHLCATYQIVVVQLTHLF